MMLPVGHPGLAPHAAVPSQKVLGCGMPARPCPYPAQLCPGHCDKHALAKDAPPMSWAQAEVPWWPQVDLLYLHNAAEAQGAVGETELLHRLHDAFVWLEHARQDGTIRAYGMATWSCFRWGLACLCRLGLSRLHEGSEPTRPCVGTPGLLRVCGRSCACAGLSLALHLPAQRECTP